MSEAADRGVLIQTRPVGGGRPHRAAAAGGILHAVGSRGAAARIAPVAAELRKRGIQQAVARIGLGEPGRDGDLLDEHGLPQTLGVLDPDRRAGVEPTAGALEAAERVLERDRPAIVVVAGDGDGALAVGLVATRLAVPVMRLGGGLRCDDFSLADEVNRVILDSVADVVVVDGPEAASALRAEGVPECRMCVAGNTAIDLVVRWRAAAERRETWARLGVARGGYVLATLDRPDTIDDDERLARLTEGLARLAERVPVVLPLHPATSARMEPMGDLRRLQDAGVRLTEALGYLDFLSLAGAAGAVLTDSGAVQDEASALGVRCFTLRRSTERRASLTDGTNVLLGDDAEAIADVELEPRAPAPPARPPWDGRAAQRVARELARRLALPPRRRRPPGRRGAHRPPAGTPEPDARLRSAQPLADGRPVLLHALGAGPDVLRIAPVAAALDSEGSFRQLIVQTGPPRERARQRELAAMLGVPEAAWSAAEPYASPGARPADALRSIGAAVDAERPVAVVVAGSSRLTSASALAATRHGVPVARLDAGLRPAGADALGGVVADRLSDLLLAPTREAVDALAAEGIAGGRVHAAGSALADSVRRLERAARERRAWAQLGVRPGEYVLVALDGAECAADRPAAAALARALVALAARLPIVLAPSPSLEAALGADALAALRSRGARRLPSAGQLERLSLEAAAGAVVTDLGDVQEECSMLGVRCRTLAAATDRPVTLARGTNALLGVDPDALASVEPARRPPTPCLIPLWDGRAARRVADVLSATYALARIEGARRRL